MSWFRQDLEWYLTLGLREQAGGEDPMPGQVRARRRQKGGWRKPQKGQMTEVLVFHYGKICSLSHIPE